MIPQRILLATDFSQPADRALAMVHTLRESLGATVHVLHVIDSPYVGQSAPKNGGWRSAEHFAAYKLGLQTALNVLGKDLGAGPAVTTELLEGRPQEVIIEAAHRAKADLICRHDRKGHARSAPDGERDTESYSTRRCARADDALKARVSVERWHGHCSLLAHDLTPSCRRVRPPCLCGLLCTEP